MNCLNPPLDQVPKDSWFCSECVDEIKLEDEKLKEKAKLETLAKRKMNVISTERRKSKKKED